MKEDELQRFLAKIVEIAYEDEIPCIVWYEEGDTEFIKGVMVGEQEFIDVWFEDVDVNKTKKVH
jgi:hypothetical protein